jgi:hypothetical protein
MKKGNKYASLIDNIKNQGWTIAPLIVITTGARGVIHQATKTQVYQSPLKLKTTATKKIKIKTKKHTLQCNQISHTHHTHQKKD